MSEKIIRVSFSNIERNSFISVKSTGKIITVYKSENTTVDTEIFAEIEIFPSLVLRLVMRKWKFMSF